MHNINWYYTFTFISHEFYYRVFVAAVLHRKGRKKNSTKIRKAS